MKIVFFRRPKPRQFDYKPIYWDEEKEEMERLKKRIDRAGKEKSGQEIRDDLRFEIDRNWRRNRAGSSQKVNLLRFLIYLAFALFMIYFIFFTDFINKFLSYFVR
jgi:hypothetical protein